MDILQVINKMIISSKEKISSFEAKQEGDGNDTNKFTKAAPPPSTSSSSSRQWSAFRNPRIVRVSRSFGGKDRHSKVCTIRGLRDRRIRLSVPTAIQLYDLQDKLGLSQPSKVIDWLLDATKNDIDKLPPLQLPQGFGQFHHQMLFSHHHHHSNNTNNVNAISQSSLIASPFFHDPNLTFNNKDGGGGFHSSLGININNNNSSGLNNDGENQERIAEKSKYWELDQPEPEPEPDPNHPSIIEKGKWIKTNYDQENNNQDGGFCNYSTNYGGQVSLAAQKLFPLTSNNFLNNSIPFNSYNYHWDASDLSLSHGFLPQSSLQASLNNNSTTTSSSTNITSTVPLPSSLAFSSNSQFLFCPAPSTMSSLLPQYYPHPPSPLSDHNDSSRDSQHILPTSRTISLPIKNFSLNVNSGFAQYSQSNNNQRQQQPADKDTATS